MTEMTPVQVLREYFGLKHGQTLAEFAKELKALSPEERNELVLLAAEKLGVTVKDPK